MEFSFDRFYQLNRKAIIWIVLFGLIYVLRDFFTLIFLTFIIGFFAMPAADWLSSRFRLGRRFAISVVYLGIFLGYLWLAWLIIPSLAGQILIMTNKLPGIQAGLFEARDEYAEKYPGLARMVGLFPESPLLEAGDILGMPRFLQRLESGYGDDSPSPARRVMESLDEETRKRIEEVAARTKAPGLFETGTPGASGIFEPDPDLEPKILQALNDRVVKKRDFFRSWDFEAVDFGRNPDLQSMLERGRGVMTDREVQRFNRMLLEAAFPEFVVRGRLAEDELESFIDKARDQVQQRLPDLAGQVFNFFLNSLLAIFFSFLICYDYARLSQEVKNLANSKLRDFYEEAGEPVVRFALEVGKGFQAIVVIAFITAAMIVPILLAFRVEAVTLLGIIVFLTSLVPVLGVPPEFAAILLVAFNSQGPAVMIYVGIGLVIVHLLIGNVIAPAIFGRQFRMNMVLMLLILYFGNQIGGVWGMILGVPIANYVLRDVLKIPFPDREIPTRPLLAAAGPQAGPALENEPTDARPVVLPPSEDEDV